MSVEALNRILAKEDKENNQSLLYLLQTLGEKRLFEANEFNDIRDALRYLDNKPSGGGAVNSVTGNIVSGTATDPVITQVQTDWDAVSGLGQILNKPAIGGSDTFMQVLRSNYDSYVANTWYTLSPSSPWAGTWATSTASAGTGAYPSGTNWTNAQQIFVPSGYVIDKAYFFIRASDNPAIATTPQIVVERNVPTSGFEQGNTSMIETETLINQSMSITITNANFSLYVKELTVASHVAKNISFLRISTRHLTNAMGMAYNIILLYKKA
jgi:hypothetical protein